MTTNRLARLLDRGVRLVGDALDGLLLGAHPGYGGAHADLVAQLLLLGRIAVWNAVQNGSI